MPPKLHNAVVEHVGSSSPESSETETPQRAQDSPAPLTEEEEKQLEKHRAELKKEREERERKWNEDDADLWELLNLGLKEQVSKDDSW